MIRTIIESNALLYAIAIVGLLGILCQLAVSRRYARLIREASDAQLEKKDFMKQLRFRFRTDRKRSNEKPNIPVFVKRYLYDYHFMHMSLHQWKRLAVGLFLVSMTAAAAGLFFCLHGELPPTYLRSLPWTAAGVTAGTVLTALWTDLPYKASYLQTRLEDYLNHSGAALDFPEAEEEAVARPEKARRRIPSVIGIRKKDETLVESKAQRDKRELKTSLTRIKSGMQEAAAETERERNREILRQMDSQEQERIIRDVLAEFLA